MLNAVLILFVLATTGSYVVMHLLDSSSERVLVRLPVRREFPRRRTIRTGRH